MNLYNVRVGSNHRDIYLFLEFIEVDLLTLIRSGFCNDEQRCFIMWQIARGMKFVHSAKVVHRDLKPSNVCVNQDCSVKITDFGLARVIRPPNPKKQSTKPMIMTDYIATRWYRPPEIVLGS